MSHSHLCSVPITDLGHVRVAFFIGRLRSRDVGRLHANSGISSTCLASGQHTDQKSQTQGNSDNDERITSKCFLRIIKSLLCC